MWRICGKYAFEVSRKKGFHYFATEFKNHEREDPRGGVLSERMEKMHLMCLGKNGFIILRQAFKTDEENWPFGIAHVAI